MTAHNDRWLVGEPGLATDRGVARLGDPRVWGTFVGAAGATVFVLANRGHLEHWWSVVALAAWVVALLVYAWAVLIARRRFPPMPRVSRRAGLVYLGSVVGMLVLIRLGSAALDWRGRDQLRPALIVLTVGLHFLPFASAFQTPLFRVLGRSMAALGMIGLVAGWLWTPTAAPAAAVIAGPVMLTFMAADALASGGTWQMRLRGLSN